MLQGSISVQLISTRLGYGRVELLLHQCLPLEQRSASAHIAGASNRDNFSMCLRQAQAFSVSQFVLELVKCLLLLRAPAPSSSLPDKVRQGGACIGENLYVAAVEAARSNETARILGSFQGVFLSYLSILQGFGLGGRRGPPRRANVQPRVLHSLLHQLTFLQGVVCGSLRRPQRTRPAGLTDPLGCSFPGIHRRCVLPSEHLGI